MLGQKPKGGTAGQNRLLEPKAETEGKKHRPELDMEAAIGCWNRRPERKAGTRIWKPETEDGHRGRSPKPEL